MTKFKNRICYLCGKNGADSKDHVPPKGLLPPGKGSQNRITVPAHRMCNSNESPDEEYLRDLLIPEAIQFGYQDAESPYSKVWRAWSKPAGWKRYQEFMANAQPVALKTQSGLYAGKAIGITPDQEKVESVGKKIARGIIFHDAQAYINPEEIGIATLSTTEVPSVRERDSQERYWRAMYHPICKHTVCAYGVALRRFYQGRVAQDGSILIETHLALILWNLFFLVSLGIPLERVRNKKFTFMIETETGEWVPNTDDTRG